MIIPSFLLGLEVIKFLKNKMKSKNVIVVIGAGLIGQAIARRVGSGKHEMI